MNNTKLSKLLIAHLFANGHKVIKATEEMVETVHEDKTWTFSTVRDGDGIYVEYLDGTLNFYKSGKFLTKTVLV